MANWKKFKGDFILLVEAGFIAINQTDEDGAIKLFRAGELLDPNNSLWKVGFGYLHLHKLELKEGIKIFEGILDKEPHNDMAKALLGLCMSLAPSSVQKGEKILEQVSKSKDAGIKKLANTAIHFVDNFVKKAPGPAGKGRT